MNPELLDQTIIVTEEILGADTEIDLVTNGINIEKMPELSAVKYLDSVHLSRHRISDQENRSLMGINTPTKEQLRDLSAHLEDPGLLVLNCILSKDGVCSIESIAEYLEMACEIGVRNTSFIGMIPANDYCKQQYADPRTIDLTGDPRFRIWNQFHDYDYCSCSSGDYQAKSGWVRFYYRCPGNKQAPYARQLVYTHDNNLLKGFGGEKIRIQ